MVYPKGRQVSEETREKLRATWARKRAAMSAPSPTRVKAGVVMRPGPRRLEALIRQLEHERDKWIAKRDALDATIEALKGDE